MTHVWVFHSMTGLELLASIAEPFPSYIGLWKTSFPWRQKLCEHFLFHMSCVFKTEDTGDTLKVWNIQAQQGGIQTLLSFPKMLAAYWSAQNVLKETHRGCVCTPDCGHLICDHHPAPSPFVLAQVCMPDMNTKTRGSAPVLILDPFSLLLSSLLPSTFLTLSPFSQKKNFDL